MNTTENAMNRINVAKVTVDNISQAYGGQAFTMDDPIMQGDAPLHEYRAFGIDFPDDDQANITIEFRPNDSEPLHIQAVREGSITGEWDSHLDNTVAHEFVIVCSTHVHDTLTSVSSKSLG